MEKIVLITGATSGFGKAIAIKFASQHWNCIIAGRRKNMLLQLSSELHTKFGAKIFVLPIDVRDRDQVTHAIGSLPDIWKNIDVLVNNAGLALGRDSFESAEIDDWETMIDTNVKGLLYVSKAVIPQMISRKSGHIINMGSTASKEVYKNGNVYCATKFAVDAISQSQRIDLLPYNIKVTCINPGAADTEFSLVRFKGDKRTAKKVYDGYEPLHADDVADICFYCAALPPNVCINDLTVTAVAQANSVYFEKKSQ